MKNLVYVPKDLEDLAKLHDLALEKLEYITPPNNDEPKIALAALYATSIETVGSIILLFREKKTVLSFAALRSLLEASVDIINLVNSESYYKDMLLTHKYYLKNILSEGVGSTKRINFNDDQKELEKRINGIDQQINELKAGGAKSLKPWEKFILANKTDQYNTLYATLCTGSHNNISALSNRHFPRNEDGREMSIYAKGTFEPWIVDFAHRYLTECSEITHVHFETGAAEQFPRA